ncbi:MAG: 4-hydroxyphenylacetate 3-hydroxylase N-terminal domain-containing protein, partial [Anaerolineae bacterium]
MPQSGQCRGFKWRSGGAFGGGMRMKTAGEYTDSLRDLRREVYILGERVEDFVEHPILRPSLNALAMTYELACDPT